MNTTAVASSGSGQVLDPDIAVLNNGRVVVVWEDTAGTDTVRASVLDGNTGSMISTNVVASSNDFRSDPKVTHLTNGGFVVAYRVQSNSFPETGRGVRAKTFAPDGTPFSDEIIVNSRFDFDQSLVDVTGLRDGGFFIAFADSSNGDHKLQGQRFDVFGNRVGEEVSIDTRDVVPASSSQAIAVTELEDGRIVATYGDGDADTDGSAAGILSQILDPRDGVVVGDRFENTLYGNFTNDEISAKAGEDTLFGLNGYDYLFGGDGNDVLEGGQGTDALYGGDGSDTASYANAASGVSARLDTQSNFGEAAGDFYSSIENLTGSQFVDFLVGDGGANTLSGLGGNDTLFGEGGDDIIIGGTGAATINGGQGNDTASFAGASAGVTARLDGLAGTGDAAGDTFADIENLVGTDFNDLLVGNGFGNTLEGGAEGDFLFGFGGNDVLIGGAGADALNGGDGRDTASYTTSNSGVQVRLDGAPGSGDAAGDSFNSIEDVTGSNSSDFLVGDGQGNILRGLNGFDTIFGEGGNDVLFGGKGEDILNGGVGSDTFYYDAITDSPFGHPGDTIQDFDATDPNEVLFFAGLAVGNFQFIGSNANNFTGGNDNSEARFNDTTKYLELDFDGDGNADIGITLQGVSLANLGADDFMFG